jgi:DNA-binding response OmpR family regulator
MANILIIDDERSVRSLLRAVLESENHHVFEASNGRVGLELYRERSFDLIITDLTMPEMDGLDLISELTRSFLSVKVIAMTGGSESGSRLTAAKLLGARSTLQKPFPMDTFLSLVRYELQREAL